MRLVISYLLTILISLSVISISDSTASPQKKQSLQIAKATKDSVSSLFSS